MGNASHDPMSHGGRRQFRSLADDPFWNLALEVWLLRHLPESAAWLLTYVNAPAVILGCNQNPWRETDPDALAAAGIHLVRRTSGGGAVYHGPGNLNVSLLTPRPRHDARLLEGVLRETLAALGIAADVTPRHGLECGGRKISGGAFQFTGHTVLHHLTLLVTADLECLETALRPAPVAGQIAGAAVASVRSPVVNLAALRPGLDLAAVETALTRRWSGNAAAVTPLAPDQPWPPPAEVAALRAEFATWEWRFGRTPEFTVRDWCPEPGRPPVTTVVRHGRIHELQGAESKPCQLGTPF